MIKFKFVFIVCLLAGLSYVATGKCSAAQICKADVNGDCKVNISDLVTMKSEYFRTDCESCSPPYPTPLQETGQTVSYADGDDGWYKHGVAWTSQRFTDNGDGTILDNMTGLVWLKNANCFGLDTWSDAISACDGLASGSCGLTDGSAPGDWSLPNINELFSLIDRSQDSPALPPDYPFANIQDYYWTSTTAAYNNAFAWYVYVGDGFSDFDLKSTGNFSWPVKSLK